MNETFPDSLRLRLLRQGAVARQQIRNAQSTGKRVGLVPTMGALHEGHLSLVRTAREECDVVVATIFVNPSQFGPRDDFSRYPRNLSTDLEMLDACETDLVFVPSIEEIYPPGFSTYIQPPAVAEPLEGVVRPGHFRGVCTVVLKLFQLLPADFAFFGQKDYQQSLVVRRMATDLNSPVVIRVCPTVRESDGLAMSSRNLYFNPDERQQASAISRALRVAVDSVERGERDAGVLIGRVNDSLVSAGIERIDYVAITDTETLASSPVVDGPKMLLVAAYVGKTRLIDNCQIG